MTRGDRVWRYKKFFWFATRAKERGLVMRGTDGWGYCIVRWDKQSTDQGDEMVKANSLFYGDENFQGDDNDKS